MTLNTCSPIVGTHVMDFQREVDLLEAWAKFVQTVDPDVVIGYNIANFDFPYLLDRAKALKATKFPYLGREKSACRAPRAALQWSLTRLHRHKDGGQGHALLV
jgi:DNA polymerase delta subunit 1